MKFETIAYESPLDNDIMHTIYKIPGDNSMRIETRHNGIFISSSKYLLCSLGTDIEKTIVSWNTKVEEMLERYGKCREN